MHRRTTTAAAVLALLASTGAAPALAAAGLACTRPGVTESAEKALAANSRSHVAGSDESWDASKVRAVTLKSTITIKQAGTYRLRGTVRNGQVIVASGGNGIVRLILAGVNITSSKGPAILVTAAAKTHIVLQEGTANVLTDGPTRAKGDTAAAALYSKDPLTISGAGALTVNGRYADGIASTDGLVISGGSLTVKAKDDGIRGKDFLQILNGIIKVTATGDGIRSSGKNASTNGYVYVGGGSISVTTKSDAIQGMTDVIVGGGTLALTAAKSALTAHCLTYVEKADIRISAGNDALHSSGETVVRSGTITIAKAYEGLEGRAVLVAGGTITMTTSDDGINVSGGNDGAAAGSPTPTATPQPFTSSVAPYLQIDGGTIVANTQGDGIDINGPATITGGRLVISGPTANDNGALDVDGAFTVSGGLIIGLGSSGMAMGPNTSSPQAAILGNFATAQGAGTIVHVADEGGKVLASFKSPKAFASIVYTSAQLVKGKAYKLYIGGSVSGSALGGYHSEGSISGATLYGTVTAGSYSNAGPGGPRP